MWRFPLSSHLFKPCHKRVIDSSWTHIRLIGRNCFSQSMSYFVQPYGFPSSAPLIWRSFLVLYGNAKDNTIVSAIFRIHCVLRVSILFLSTIFLLTFGTRKSGTFCFFIVLLYNWCMQNRNEPNDLLYRVKEYAHICRLK